jgi:hypothetical protein
VLGFVTDSDEVTSLKTINHTNKGGSDQDQLKWSFVGLWTPTGSDRLDSRRI